MKKRRLLWLLPPLVLLGAACATLESHWLRETLRARLVEQVTRGSGGRAELQALDFSLRRLTITLRGFTLHGREPAGRAPLFDAARIEARLEIDGLFRPKVRLAALEIERPRFRLYVYPDGYTNLPRPSRAGPPEDFVTSLLRAKIGHLAITEGLFDLDSHLVPFAMQADQVKANLTYDAALNVYKTEFTSGAVYLPGPLRPSLEASAVMERGRIRVEHAHVQLGATHADATGAIDNLLRPSLRFDYHGAALLSDIEPSPVREGFGTATGVLTYDLDNGLRISGHARTEQLGYAARGIHVRRVAAECDFVLTPSRLLLNGLRVKSPYGDWNGTGDLRDWSDFTLAGRLTRMPLDKMRALVSGQPYPWNADLTGPLTLSGHLSALGADRLRLDARLRVEPLEGQLPVRGELNAAWRQETGTVDFDASELATATARLSFHGVLGERLEAHLASTNLEELAPVIALASGRSSVQFPVTLDHGRAELDAVITGPMDSPEIRGHVRLANVVYATVHYNRVTAAYRINSTRLEIEDFVSHHEPARITGRLSLALDHWQPTLGGQLKASARVERGDIARLVRLFGPELPLAGTVDAAVEVEGSPGNPRGTLKLSMTNGNWGEERFEHFNSEMSLDAAGALRGSMALDRARATLDGHWTHPRDNPWHGTLNLHSALESLPLAEIETLRDLRPGMEGILQGDLRAAFAIDDGRPTLGALDGELRAAEVKLGSRSLGALRVWGETKAGTLSARATLALPQGTLEGDARVQMSGSFPAEGRLHLPRLTFGLLHDVITDPSAEPWPVRGFLDGTLTFSGPLSEPRRLGARLTVATLQVRPRQQEVVENQPDTNDLTLRNSAPLVIEYTSGVAYVRQAKLTALETDLTLAGSYTPGARAPWNIDVDGTANLAVAGSFYKDLLAAGSARVHAALRGESANPRMSGRMVISNASFFLKDLPNGIEQAEGTILFDQNRANIERFEGRTGAGRFRLGGFVGFHTDELIYRLQAQATSVRVRYPEGVSTTLNAELTLTGSTRRALLAGTITVERSGFNLSSDLANLVGSAGNPIPTAATQNEFLRNLQFDVRVRTSPDAVFLSTYTTGLQTTADLRLRGSPAKPILLGSIKANQGQVNFLGNRYAISRGEILFYNAAIVQPQIDLDLETRVRGITVYLNVAGPLSRINVNYRSEPPLQSSEILALLTVGRAPSSTTTSIATSDRIRTQTEMENSAATQTLLGGALTSALNRRSERLFGASRIRIDPSSTNVDNLPSARLSIERSISRDITLTYITNLNRSQQQVVQLEWDLSRQWSLIAIKDENGTFAVDFLFRRRF
jgi:translocation and assembly module TamB